jgi:DNA-binding CsgD family transcriptional regulator
MPDMERAHFIKRSSVFWGSAFLVGCVFTAISAFLRYGLLMQSLPTILSVFLVSILMFMPYFFHRLVWLQPIVFFLVTSLNLIQTYDSFYGLGFFVVGMLMLFRLGFFDKSRVLRLSICLGWLFLSEILGGILSGRSLVLAASPPFFFAIFLIYLYLSYQEKLTVYLKEPRPPLSLSQKGLSAAERSYVHALAEGKNMKEIAVDFEIAESTVRNTLTRAYKKLGVEDLQELMVLLATHELAA